MLLEKFHRIIKQKVCQPSASEKNIKNKDFCGFFKGILGNYSIEGNGLTQKWNLPKTTAPKMGQNH